MSNYHYLMHINSMGHRSLNDLAQYPVLPWVLRYVWECCYGCCSPAPAVPQ